MEEELESPRDPKSARWQQPVTPLYMLQAAVRLPRRGVTLTQCNTDRHLGRVRAAFALPAECTPLALRSRFRHHSAATGHGGATRHPIGARSKTSRVFMSPHCVWETG